MTTTDEFVPYNITPDAIGGGHMYKYDTMQEIWVDEIPLQLNNGSGVKSTFCCGMYGANSRSGTLFGYGGSNYAGTTRLDPISKSPEWDHGLVDEPNIGNGNVISIGLSDLRWSNVTGRTEWVEGGVFLSLPGKERDDGGIFIQIGGMMRRQETVRNLI